jgi:hypothetical protein
MKISGTVICCSSLIFALIFDGDSIAIQKYKVSFVAWMPRWMGSLAALKEAQMTWVKNLQKKIYFHVP